VLLQFEDFYNQETSTGTKIYKMADSTSHVFVAKLYQQCIKLLFDWSLIPSLNTFISGIALSACGSFLIFCQPRIDAEKLKINLNHFFSLLEWLNIRRYQSVSLSQLET
jgi:hypothetical protein